MHDARSRVLVIEDDAAFRVTLVDALRAAGFSVLAMAAADTALTHVDGWLSGKESPPDAIVTDLKMRGASGLDLVTVLRGRGLDIPVVLVTAFGDRDVHRRAALAGATSVFDKPFDLDDLVATLIRFRREEA